MYLPNPHILGDRLPYLPLYNATHPFFSQLPTLTGKREPGPGSGLETLAVTKDK